jgi:hypothetical protein
VTRRMAFEIVRSIQVAQEGAPRAALVQMVRQTDMRKIIKIFLASSAELTSDREQFEIFINRKNNEWVEKDVFLKLVIWEDFLDAISQTRLQEEYNKAIRDCDIFVMLFFTKVGIYTAEEFETAFGQFKETNKPLIYTYFKDAEVLIGRMNRQDVMSLFAFQDKLTELGHFYTPYKNVDDLKFQINNQLDKLLTEKTDSFIERAPRLEDEIKDIYDMTNWTLIIDEKILQALRYMENLPAYKKSMIYQDILKGNLVEKNTSLRDFFREDLPRITEQLSIRILEDVVVRVKVDSRFEDLRYKTNSFEIRVENPLLTWDCHCSTPNGVIPEAFTTKSSREIPCPIHGDKNGTNLTDVYRSQLRQISFDGTTVLFKTSPEFWPPTIDSFMMCRNLVSNGILKEHYRTVLDLGCGTGFLGIHIGINNPNINTIYLADWLLTPLVYCMMSWKLNQSGNRKRTMKPLLGLNSNWIPSEGTPQHFDLCVCNPPYLPSLKEFPEIKIHHTVGGTELLEHIICKGTEIAGETYINFSDIAMKEAERAAEEFRKFLEPVGNGHLVPFTVPQAFKYPGYIDKLVDENRLVANDETRYKYWHGIKTYLIKDINFRQV